MKYYFFAVAPTVVILNLLGNFATAQATIIGANPNTNFTNSSVSFAIGNAQYKFINNTSQLNELSVATSGSAQVSLFGIPPRRPHKPGGVGGADNSLPIFNKGFGPQHYSYDAFPNATPSPNFNFFAPYLGLKFELDDGTHYGFAKIKDSNTLDNYAYNSVAGAGITTGATIKEVIDGKSVPEPSSLAMLGMGLCFIVRTALRRRRSER